MRQTVNPDAADDVVNGACGEVVHIVTVTSSDQVVFVSLSRSKMSMVDYKRSSHVDIIPPSPVQSH